MYVMYVCHEYPLEGGAETGGIATYVNNIAETFHAHGDRVLVVTLSDACNGRVSCGGIAVECVKVPPVLKKIKRLIRSRWLGNVVNAYRIRRRMDRIIREDTPDIIQYANFLSVGLFMPRRIPGCVRISSDNVLWREAFRADFDFERSYRKITLEDRLEYLTIRKCTSVFCPSRVVADITEDRTGRKVSVIESPARPGKEWDDSVYASCASGKKYLLFFGTLCRLKGIHIIADGLEEILRMDQDLYFVFIGRDYGHLGRMSDMSAREYLTAAAGGYADRVIILDPLPRAQLAPFVRHSAACVLPSVIDNLPNTCIEAMGYSRIVIGSHGASFEQLIEDGVNGLLIRNGSTAGLVKAVQSLLLMTEADRCSMGARARETVKRLAPDIVYGKMKAYYMDVIAQQTEDKR